MQGGMKVTPNQQLWSQARDRLARSVAGLGYPEEFAGLLAGQLGSPKAVRRMASYLDLACPGSLEEIIDEMLAICAEIEAWRQKKESRAARAGYGAWLRSEARLGSMDDEN